MNSSKKSITLTKLNIASQKVNLFGGSDKLDPIAYPSFETKKRHSTTENLFTSVESYLAEIDEAFGQLGYVHRELKKSLKKS